MRKYLFFQAFWIIILAATVCCGVAMTYLVLNEENNLKVQMKDQLELMSIAFDEAEQHDETLALKLSEVSEKARIVFIDDDGDVYFDTAYPEEELSKLENHMDRPEIIMAQSTGFGTDTRHSETLNNTQIYAAIRTSNNEYIRMSYPLNSVWSYLPQFIMPMILALLVAIVVAIIFSRRITNKTIASLEEIKESFSAISHGDYDSDIARHNHDEINDLIRVFNRMRITLKDNVSRLDKEKKRISFMLESMEEGVVLVNSSLEIITLNSAGSDFFGSERAVEGKSLLEMTQNPRIISAMENAIKSKQSAIFNLELRGKIVGFHVTPVSSSLLNYGGESGMRYRGALMVLRDATMEKNSEKMRQEFFANAGHELKTPLTSILGFAEIIERGIVSKEDEERYTAHILREAKKMAALINDILEISKLESSPPPEDKTTCNITAIARDVRKTLMPLAHERNITIDISENDAYIFANEKQMIKLVENIMSNATKYNKDGGSVKVDITEDDKRLTFTVSDTGVGIPDYALSRVFERFFRVDKGRSRKEGSTGLGLAIVKHIVNTNRGEVSLESTEGKGTKVVVRLPKQ